MIQKLQQVEKEMAVHRDEVIYKLGQFSLTDMLLFWGQEKDLVLRQELLWGPILNWAKQELDTKFETTQGLDVPESNKTSAYRLKLFMESLTDKELAAFYTAALDMRSVLLAAALVKGRINAETAFEAAFLEEIWQAESWGKVDEAEKKRSELKKELKSIETYLNS